MSFAAPVHHRRTETEKPNSARREQAGARGQGSVSGLPLFMRKVASEADAGAEMVGFETAPVMGLQLVPDEPRSPASGAWSADPPEAPPNRPLADQVVQRKCAACEALEEEPVIQRSCVACDEEREEPVVLQRKCASCNAEDLPWPLQRKCAACEGDSTQRESQSRTSSVGSSIERMQSSGGQPLSASARSFAEPRFGRDFSSVRVHMGAEAASASRALNARAFTMGEHVVFGPGEYRPDTQEGKLLLAHELTHVLQQRKVGATSLDPAARQYSSAGHEREADQVAATVTRGGSVRNWSPRAAGNGFQPSLLGDAVGGLIDVGGDLIEGGADLAGDAFEGTADIVGGVSEFGLDLAGDVAGGGLELAGDLVDSDALRSAGRATDSALDAAGSFVNDTGDAIGAFGNDTLDAVGGMTNAGLDEVADFARHGYTFALPDLHLCPPMSHTFKLPKVRKEFDIVKGYLPITGPLLLRGSLGIAFEGRPSVQLSLGPCWLKNISVTIHPLGRTSATATLSVATGGALMALFLASVRGEIGASLLVPVGGIPIIVDLDPALAALELGGFGFFQLSLVDQLEITPDVGFQLPGLVDVDFDTNFSIGGALDAYAGVFGKLEAFDKLICEIIWPLAEYHKDGGMRFNLGLSGGWFRGVGGLAPTDFDVSPIPFDDIDTALKREPPKSNCPLTDEACKWLRYLGLLPSQNGGSWSWAPPPAYGPGRRLAGPLDVYEIDPSIPSGALCRGACGPDCDTCVSHPTYSYTDPATGVVWTYVNYQECNTHEGCREHDAGFDWAAAEHGERGGGWVDMIRPRHMAANIECTCNHDVSNCIGWVIGMPPHDDDKLLFADSASTSPGGGRADCKKEHPEAVDCNADPRESRRELALQRWGGAFGFAGFHDFTPGRAHAPGEQVACETAPGRLWMGKAIDLYAFEVVLIGIYECLCCEDSSATGSEWREPHIVRLDNLVEELLLRLCDEGLLDPADCDALHRRVRERYGDEFRDPDVNPDEDVYLDSRRTDDAPLIESFRRRYNRIDSWYFYVHHNHPAWAGEFDLEFEVVATRNALMQDLKAQTLSYKREFRDLATHDVAAEERSFRQHLLEVVQTKINELNRRIAIWYREKTGSTEDLDELTERIHAAGTEIWRREWLAAVLAVNRVLSRLWPGAKRRLEGFMHIQRLRHPLLDLSGTIGDITYIGSTAKGYKGPPKQYVRFNPEKFDVDANLEAPPLAKYAIGVDGRTPDRERISGRQTSIAPLIQFSVQAHLELRQEVRGYEHDPDPAKRFDVFIEASPTDEQRRETEATERIYRLRGELSAVRYAEMMAELRTEGLVYYDARDDSRGVHVRPDLTAAESVRLTGILDRYEP